MIVLYLLLVFVTGCASQRYYYSPEVAKVLEKNDYQLRSISSFIQKDYSSKKAFFDYYTKQTSNKNPFMIHDLKSRLADLKLKRDAILARSHYIKSINAELLNKVSETQKVEQKDPLFNQIESFTTVSNLDAKNLYDDVEKYQKSSEDFIRFTMLTRNSLFKTKQQ